MVTQLPGHIDLRQITTAVGLLVSIIEGSDDAIIAKDLNGTIISWNPAAERLFEYTEQEAVGQAIEMLIPDDHKGEDRVVMDRILAGAPVEHYETERITKSGRRVNVSLTVSALRDLEGHVVGASKIMRDVSGVRESREMQELLAAVVESSDDAIIAKDSSGIITSWNASAERIFGYTAAEAVGQHVSMLLPEDLVGRERDILNEILAGQKVDHYETRRSARDGRVVDVSLTVSPLRDADGTIIGASKVVRDITERNRIAEQARRADQISRANEQLAAADRLKDQFLAMANHELRTPLTAISGFTRTLIDLEDQIEPEQRREFLDIISNQADRLTRIVEDMLTLSRLSLGEIVPRVEPVGVADAVQRVLRENDRPGINVLVEDDAEVVAAVDPHHLQQMVLNYVDNACKYGAEPIDVLASREGDHVFIRVRDHGEGVSPQFEPQLFDRFSRGAAGISTNASGVGLGLSIVRGLARAQGGDAWHEPNEPTGAQFCLRLPAADAP
ncbi:MAG: hypothetical protein JWM98_2557 [Thermoleophilia bacterium]|nr:hypothetical protein [Thermoleophilia bacterium]